MSELPRVAVVGLGGLFPGAATPGALWRNVLDGVDAASEPPPGRWLLPPEMIHEPGVIRPDRVPSRRACFLPPFVPDLDGLDIDPALVGRLDPVFQLALSAGAQAWRSARMGGVDRRRVGVILGAIALPTETTSALTRHVLGRELYRALGRPFPFEGESPPHPLNVHVTGLPAGLLARALRLGGGAFTLDAACASSLYAVKLAVDELQAGRADAMLAGGLSRPDSLYTQMGFAQLRALSPTGRCSPFDLHGDGLVVGEGAGVFVLKRLDDARRDGDRVLGVIAGAGLSNDVAGGLLAPASEGQLRAMRAAYEQAGWRPDEVGLVECHATGTPVGDAVEFQSLKTLWEDYPGEPGRCVVGSVKSTVGHLLTGAGAAALTKVLFALSEGVLPPTANFERPPPALGMESSPFRVLRRPEPWHGVRRAAISAFGFGGINAHLLIERDVGQAFQPVSSRPASTGWKACPTIVAAEARLGPYRDLPSAEGVLLGMEAPSPPEPPRRWWGIDGTAFPGHYVDAVDLSAERLRIPPREVEEMLPQQVLLLDVAARALAQVELTDAERLRTGVFVGVGLDMNTTNFHLRWCALRDEPALADVAGPALTANRVMGALASIAASRIARAFRLGGPSFTLSAAETSGLAALHTAVRALERGEIDVALVGAVDLPGDVRIARDRGPTCDGAVALVLRRGDVTGLATVDAVTLSSGDGGGDASPLGRLGAAEALAGVVRGCVGLRRRVLTDGRPRPWLTDEGERRRADVVSAGADGSRARVELSDGGEPPGRVRVATEGLFVVGGNTPADLLAALRRLRDLHASHPSSGIDVLARAWLRLAGCGDLTVSLLARDREQLADLIDAARSHLQREPDRPFAAAGRVFYSPRPLAREGKLALVFPGSGNDFLGMGRELALAWPEVLARQEGENRRLRSQYLPELFWGGADAAPTVRQRIFAQVALGTLIADILAVVGVRPDAAIGYSLGESAALFGLRGWRDRDGMLERMNVSTLFVSDLTGRCDAARAAWGLRADEAVDWRSGIVERTPDEVRAALTGLDRAYLQIVNTPRECVIGGQRTQVEELVRRLGATLVPVPETTTMHCPVVGPVGAAYRELHRLPTTPSGVRFYSAGCGRAYDLDPDAAADAILTQAVDTIDFPAVVEAAYGDGVRLFVEAGPGGSCSRMIAAILGDRPHLARSVCVPGADGMGALLRVLAALAAEGVPIDLTAVYDDELAPADEGRKVVVPVGGEPFRVPVNIVSEPRPSGSGQAAPLPDGRGSDVFGAPLAQMAAVIEARGAAHAAYFRLNQALQTTFADALAFQGQLFEAVLTGQPLAPAPRAVALDREQCLEFAVGSIANVLGPAFAEVDTFPMRVRLPDEPLMLVDRILTIDGAPLSMTPGRVVTEHDVLPGAWYLDGGRIPTCIAIEAGQADLFLSGYLGIDFQTRGRAVYRLLDAAVTFHRGLPRPGETIRYDIHIDHFFRQGDTHLFRFHFVGSVDGEPLLTMTDGCAGFFSEAELNAGKGVVLTELQRRPRQGVLPDDEDFLPPMAEEAYSEAQVEALRRGDLAGCFGPLFADLPLRAPLRLPGGRMRLVHRVTAIEPRGGRFSAGLIRAEADIDADDWFLTCHFIDDQVMPGTLMYECCLHTLRVFLLRLGWVGEEDEVVCEPVPGVASRLKCRGQVTEQTKTVTYEVVVKERGYRPEPYAICDAHMVADGKLIVDISDLCLRMSGLTREKVAAVWRGRETQAKRTGNEETTFTRAHILAFAQGKPSEAFGAAYRPFDDGRFIARLPRPPYSFLDRVRPLTAQAWTMAAGGTCVAEYDVPPDAWFFAANRAAVMPFAVLQEIALQACGWMSAFMGAALTSGEDLHYRNLGGDAELLRPVTPQSGTLRTHVRCKGVSSTAGMIIHEYEFETRDAAGPVYRGTTNFGFFTPRALAQQVGLRDAKPLLGEEPGEAFDYPSHPPFADRPLRMLDRVTRFVAGDLERLEAVKRVDPGEWFFAAHFYQDPVWPGSLGLEALLQLVAVAAARRWGTAGHFETNLGRHRWQYRGQVVPANGVVTVQAAITASDEPRRELTTDGLLGVDGLWIYRMSGFRVRLVPDGAAEIGASAGPRLIDGGIG